MNGPVTESTFLYCWLSSSLWKAFSSIVDLSIHCPPFEAAVEESSSESKVSMCRWTGLLPTISTALFISSMNTPLAVRVPWILMITSGCFKASFFCSFDDVPRSFKSLLYLLMASLPTLSEAAIGAAKSLYNLVANDLPLPGSPMMKIQ